MTPNGNGNGLNGWPNPFSPQWMGFTPALVGYRDVEIDLALPVFSLTAGQMLSGGNALQLPISGDADHLLYEFKLFLSVPGGLVSDLRVRMRDGEGNLITSDYVQAIDLAGQFGPALRLLKGSTVLFEVQNVGTVTLTAQFILRCVKRVPDQAEQGLMPNYKPMYDQYSKPPAGFHDESYSYYFEFVVNFGVPAVKFPLATESDADFLWRATAGNPRTSSTALGISSATKQTVITLYDPNGQPLTSRNVGSEVPITPYESVLSGWPGRATPIYPEVLIPRGGVISVDVLSSPFFFATTTFQIELRGVKRFPGD
jgi:hypothetical protein